MRAGTIVSGHFLKAGEQLQITLEVTDVESNRLLWSDVFDAPAQNMMAMQAQIAAKTRRAMAPVLGVSEFVTDNPPKPKNEDAYDLYLRAKTLTSEVSTDPKTRNQAIEMLNRSVALDPSYAPAWELLASWYAADGWFGDGGEAALARWRALADKIVVLDPDNVIFRADVLYIGSGAGATTGGMTRGQAYRGLQDLLRRRPDSARLHFIVSWMLRDTGLLEESARECETSVLIDAQDAGARSCGVTFMLLGDYRRALNYLHLDPDSEVAKAVSIDVLLRQGKEKDVLQAMSGKLPQWGGYGLLMAYLQRRPAPRRGGQGITGRKNGANHALALGTLCGDCDFYVLACRLWRRRVRAVRSTNERRHAGRHESPARRNRLRAGHNHLFQEGRLRQSDAAGVQLHLHSEGCVREYRCRHVQQYSGRRVL